MFNIIMIITGVIMFGTVLGIIFFGSKGTKKIA